MKRIVLFVVTNLAVMLVLSIVLSLLGVGNPARGSTLNLGSLMVFSLVVGFTGSIFSLLISKPVAKWSTGARVIDNPSSSTELWLVNTVRALSERAGIGMPEVAVYDGEANAFATGAFKNSALVAVSTGLLESMNRDEVEAVLGHEIAHVANGDMVTLTLIQGVVNTFVVFMARVVGFFVDNVLLKNNNREGGGRGIGYFVTVMVCEVLFGLLASIIVAWFSRQREFRADAGSAKLLGSPTPMMHALARLGGVQPGELPQSMQALGISGGNSGWGALFATHPPIEQRIAALRGVQS
ncbi:MULTISPECIES: protease HtpX [unclassified Janthinobacterium]|uniref:protease HtpX n=1 Tax=unclassified Janthinobacterium TaxID=2610881 RepID=UPI001609B039|nr:MULTISPECIES: protease HtpX [unclassified Janthinobacterium]MBB5367373.1 heat shock protein HtpX [Janthinobacterium sp. K2C7]MBB5380149.1 heat shock protein HtpX [Janthinobacterium sp. K2Li3]MBB5385755.1 heat shock protein HtpX [Janthinobacterium sp. K2E3]